MGKVIFTDLDGTLLDSFSYSYDQALKTINLLRKKQIPIVFCSNKTKAEQEAYREELNIRDPFIVENGGAVFIPKDYFPFPIKDHKTTEDYLVIELGIPNQKVRAILKKIEKEVNCRIKGFGDMDVEEIARETGLNLRFAALAKQRQYDETFKIEASPEKIKLALDKIEKAGLTYTYGGRYYSAMGEGDKGKATKTLIELYRRKLGEIETIGIGDNQNDIPMLEVVDIPVLVQKPDHSWEEIGLANTYKVKGIGPEGWSRAIRKLIES
jgi:mannosyl-3-phosphoglycerate phosphatase